MSRLETAGHGMTGIDDTAETKVVWEVQHRDGRHGWRAHHGSADEMEMRRVLKRWREEYASEGDTYRLVKVTETREVVA